MELHPGHSNGRQRYLLLKRSGVSHQRATCAWVASQGNAPVLVIRLLFSAASLFAARNTGQYLWRQFNIKLVFVHLIDESNHFLLIEVDLLLGTEGNDQISTT